MHCVIFFLFVGDFAKYRNRLLISSCLSIHPSVNVSVRPAPIGRIFMKFDIYENLLTRITSTSHEDLSTFTNISVNFMVTPCIKQC